MSPELLPGRWTLEDHRAIHPEEIDMEASLAR